MPDLSKPSVASRLFLLLFSTPFAGIGVGAGVMGVSRLLTGGISTAFFLIMGFAAAFGGIGFGLMYAAYVSGQAQRKMEMAPSLHPDAPWMWRADWASGRIQSGTKIGKFGTSYLQLASVPGVIGGKLSGVIQARFDPTTENRVRVMLTCWKVTGIGDDRRESIVWRDEHVFGHAEIGMGELGAMIPVEFALSDDVPSSTQNQVFWRVDVKADLPGLDYRAQFEVPVFKTAASPAAHHPQPAAEVRPPEKPSIIIRPMPTGGTQFVFPAARNMGMAMVFTVLFLATTALTFIVAKTSFLALLISSPLEVIFLVLTLKLWFGVERILVDSEKITTRNTILGVGRDHQFARDAVAELKLTVGMQTHRAEGAGTAYYDIQLIDRTGRPFTLAGEIKNKQEADWILSELRRVARL